MSKAKRVKSRVLSVFCGLVLLLTIFPACPLTVFAAEGDTIFDSCDSASGWQSGNTLSLDTTDKKEGTGCLSSVGSNIVQFYKAFSTSVDTVEGFNDGAFQLWYYVSDVTKLSDNGQIEISSSGTNDTNEYGWAMSGLRPNLHNGWNLLTLKIDEASVTGGTPDLTGINWLRVYDEVTGSITIKIDDLRFVKVTDTILDNCDSSSVWQSGNTLSIDTSDKKEGSGALSSTGSATNQFYKMFSSAVDTAVGYNDGALQFWYYVSDVTKLSDNGQVEISSSGASDLNEYSWQMSAIRPGLHNGWNLLTLKITDALVSGGTPDLAGINWFRIYDAVTGSITAKIDDLRFVKVQGEWNFNSAGNTEGWSIGQNMAGSVSGGYYNLTVTGSDPYIYSQGSLRLDASVHKSLKIKLKNNTTDTVAQLYWKKDSESTWSASSSQRFLVKAGDTGYSDYFIDLTSNSSWMGTIEQLRIDPAINVSSGTISIDSIVVEVTGDPYGEVLQLTVGNESSAAQNFYYQNAFSNTSYTFQAGDYLEYDVRIFDNIGGAGGIEIVNSDGSYFRDTAGWQDQNGIGGHPGSDISAYAYNNWYHRKLAVPDSLVGKTVDHWNVVGENDTTYYGYMAQYDNIAITNGSSIVRKTVFRSAKDCNMNSVDTSSQNTFASMRIENIDQTPMPLQANPTGDCLKLVTNNSGTDGALQFWYYVSDVTKLSDNGQVEISSSGTGDVNEYGWSMSKIKQNLQNGWNLVNLKIDDAVITGGTPNLSAINWFRIFDSVSANIVTKIDDVKFVKSGGNIALDSCDSTSGWGSGNTLSIDTTDKKEGTGCLKSDGNNIVQFYKVFSAPVNTGITVVSGNHYYYNKFSTASYTFQSGDYIEYDVKLLGKITRTLEAMGSGGIEIANNDGSNFRDNTSWKDQNIITGSPAANISSFANNIWYHRKLAVPSGFIGKTADHWDVVGENDINNYAYTALYDNIVITNGSGTERKVIFKSASDSNVNTCDYSQYASATMSISGINGNPAPLAAPNPRIITTQFSSEDIVVADFVVTDSPYSADSTGVNDSTAAIRNAINDCYEAGGGTVWIPAGTYKVTDTINVKPYVTLRGDRRDPDSGSGSYGTVITVNLSSGDNGPVLFDMNGNATADGMTIYYPDQNAASPVAYNYTFRIKGNEVSSDWACFLIQNITMLNSYRGIGMSPPPYDSYDHQTCNISNVKGTVLYQGMVNLNSSNIDVIRNIVFSNSYWADAGSSYNAPSRSTLDSWTRSNGTGFTFAGLEWDQFYKLTCSDYNTGIQVNHCNRMEATMEFLYCTIQNTNTAVKVDYLDTRWGMSFLRSTLSGSVNSVQNNTAGYVKLTDCTLSGLYTGNVQVYSPGTSPASYTESSCPKPTRAVLYSAAAAPYNAPYIVPHTGIPSQDATSAIQNALNAAGNAGGGVVYLPAGWYKISGHLSVPANVELRGSSPASRDNPNSSLGTVLFCFEGKDTQNPDTATAAVTLGGDYSGIRGIRFFYPEGEVSGRDGVDAYPYAIRGSGAHVYSADIGLAGAYNGIDMETNTCNYHYIRNIQGTVYNKAITVGTSTEGWIETVSIDPAMVWRNAMVNIVGWPVVSIIETGYTRLNTNTVEINGAGNEHILNVFSFAANKGVYVKSGTVGIFNIGMDNLGDCTVPVDTGTVSVMNLMRYNGATSRGSATIYNEMVLVP